MGYKITGEIKKTPGISGDLRICGFAGGGTQDVNYDDVINIPIINKTGTSDNPIVFSDLNFGEYRVNGEYRYNNTSEVYVANQLYISVVEDINTNHKVIKFEQFDNSELYIVVVDYYQEDEYTEDRLSVSHSGSGEIASQVKIISF